MMHWATIDTLLMRMHARLEALELAAAPLGLGSRMRVKSQSKFRRPKWTGGENLREKFFSLNWDVLCAEFGEDIRPPDDERGVRMVLVDPISHLKENRMVSRAFRDFIYDAWAHDRKEWIRDDETITQGCRVPLMTRGQPDGVWTNQSGYSFDSDCDDDD